MTCRVTFKVRAMCTEWGETLGIVGDSEILSSWGTGETGVQSLTPSPYPIWHKSLTIPAHTHIQYKYVVVQEQGERNITKWEDLQIDGHHHQKRTVDTGKDGIEMEVDDGEFGIARISLPNVVVDVPPEVEEGLELEIMKEFDQNKNDEVQQQKENEVKVEGDGEEEGEKKNVDECFQDTADGNMAGGGMEDLEKRSVQQNKIFDDGDEEEKKEGTIRDTQTYPKEKDDDEKREKPKHHVELSHEEETEESLPTSSLSSPDTQLEKDFEEKEEHFTQPLTFSEALCKIDVQNPGIGSLKKNHPTPSLTSINVQFQKREQEEEDSRENELNKEANRHPLTQFQVEAIGEKSENEILGSDVPKTLPTSTLSSPDTLTAYQNIPKRPSKLFKPEYESKIATQAIHIQPRRLSMSDESVNSSVSQSPSSELYLLSSSSNESGSSSSRSSFYSPTSAPRHKPSPSKEFAALRHALDDAQRTVDELRRTVSAWKPSSTRGVIRLLPSLRLQYDVGSKGDSVFVSSEEEQVNEDVLKEVDGVLSDVAKLRVGISNVQRNVQQRLRRHGHGGGGDVGNQQERSDDAGDHVDVNIEDERLKWVLNVKWELTEQFSTLTAYCQELFVQPLSSAMAFVSSLSISLISSFFQPHPASLASHRSPFSSSKITTFHRSLPPTYSKNNVQSRASSSRIHPSASIEPSSKALIFDCDGVIVESEELHRLSYNACWAEENLGFEWDYKLYEKLQNSIGGGKEKMRWYFDTYGWPSNTGHETHESLISHLHKLKTKLYQQLINEGRAEIRPGVLRLMDEAHERGIKTAICSAANANAVKLVLHTLLGDERVEKFDIVLAGDDVKQKKPDPMIYNVARERLGVDVEDCVVIEDTQIGLKAAVGAGMKVVITYTSYTVAQEFDGAHAVYPNLGEVGNNSEKVVTVDVLFPELSTVTA